MILEKIRTVFPESTRTQEQDFLIGSTCLALTDKERDTIENLNFNRYHSSLDEKKREDLSVRVGEAVAKAQMWGTASGFATGGVTVGASAWYLAAFTPLATAASGVGGAISGAVVGHSLGGRIGHRRAIKDETNSPEYIFWSNQNYKKIIFPALSRYTNPTQWGNVPLECPITLDWMMKPVLAEDGHLYEKTAILAHLAAWEERLQEKKSERQRHGMGPIPPQEMQELLQARSPLRNGNVTTAGLKERPDYYEEIFEKLKHNYNIQVLEQQFIVAQAENIPQPFTEEVSKVIRFYEKTQRERSIVAADMHTDLLRSPILSDKEIKKTNEFLNAASELPRLIKASI